MGREKISSNDVHRLFLQAVLSRRIMPEKVARTLWVKCKEAVGSVGNLDIDATDSDEGWNEFLNKIQMVVNPLDLEFRGVVDDESKSRLFALVNRKGDDIAQMASDYSPAEIAYFKAVVEQIVLSQNYVYSVSSFGALRETSSIKQANITKAYAETLLASFVARGWLAKSARRRYSLATRSLLELGSYLEKYNDECVECIACQEKVFKGIMCATRNCKTFFHHSCADTWQRAHRKSNCPSCQAVWGDGNAGIKPLGEAAFNGQKEVRRTLAGEEDDDEEDDGGEEVDGTQDMSQAQPDSQPSQTQGPTQRGKGKAKANNSVKKEKKPGKKSKRRQETASDEGEDAQETEKEADEDGNMDADAGQATQRKPSRRSSRK